VTHAWNVTVIPSHVLLTGLLAVSEAAAGVLVLSGGRRTRLGYLAVIAFSLALRLFGWIGTVWVLITLPAMLLLLRAKRRAAPPAHARLRQPLPSTHKQATGNRCGPDLRIAGISWPGGGQPACDGAGAGDQWPGWAGLLHLPPPAAQTVD
jgi:hypothetical protein